jgi:hypothetical protein
MGSSSYTNYDYDVLRLNETVRPSSHYLQKEILFTKRTHFKPMLLLAIVLLSLLVWYSLRFVPLFDVKKIEFVYSRTFSSLPYQVTQKANSMLGKSLMKGSANSLQQSFETLPIVKKATVKKQLFSTLKVELVLQDPLFLITTGDNDYYFFDEDNLIALEQRDYTLFKEEKLVIEVSEAYLEYLFKHDSDATFVEISTLIALNQNRLSSSLGSIIYQKSKVNRVNEMVIALPAYQSYLHIREPVLESRLHDALGLIKLEQNKEQLYNIALGNEFRYDLYSQAMVKRQ